MPPILKPAGRLDLIALLLVASRSLCQAQTNFTAFTLVDAVPTDGIADEVTGPLLAIGELTNFHPLYNGLARARLTVQLPPAPAGSQLVHAALGVYLESIAGNADNPTFGPLCLYHSFQPNSLLVSDTDYSDTNYVLVSSSVATPGDRCYQRVSRCKHDARGEGLP